MGVPPRLTMNILQVGDDLGGEEAPPPQRRHTAHTFRVLYHETTAGPGQLVFARQGGEDGGRVNEAVVCRHLRLHPAPLKS